MSSLHVVCGACDAVNRVPADRIGQGKCGRCGGALFDAHPIALDEARFDRFATRSDLPLLVDFWAQWCGPCRVMAPVFEQAAGELRGEVVPVKVDTEQAPGLSTRFGIRSIPTLMLVKGGVEVARTAGAMDLPRLLDWVRGALRRA